MPTASGGVAPPGRRWTAAAALAILTAMMVAGLFEYNFGDSEVFMFVLVVTAFPYALRRERQVTIADPMKRLLAARARDAPPRAWRPSKSSWSAT